ncbi:hypothetical protein RZS08_38355, partial [Arthrospira platensis SPKY1]|nr:hypothetical protein [Arthrospira platensis SPKY1]
MNRSEIQLKADGTLRKATVRTAKEVTKAKDFFHGSFAAQGFSELRTETMLQWMQAIQAQDLAPDSRPEIRFKQILRSLWEVFQKNCHLLPQTLLPHLKIDSLYANSEYWVKSL